MKNSYNDVFEAICLDKAEAADMRISASILRDLVKTINEWGLTQKEAGLRLGISQPRLNDLLKGRMGKFSLETLINLATQAGLNIHVEIRKAA